VSKHLPRWIGVAAMLALVAMPDGRSSSGAPAETPVGETWVWSRMVEPKGLPLLGNESAAIFDTHRRKMLLFGGHIGNGGPQFFYTWWYDPERNAWEHARPANRPPGACCVRDGVYDEANRRTYFLGGHAYNHGWQWRAPNVHGGGTPWAYDAVANTWLPMKPLVSRRGPPWTAGVYDREHQVVVTYGGEGFYETDVWVYDGYTNTWTRLARQGAGPDFGGHAPPMAYDAAHGKVLLYGCGYGNKSRDELWAYDLRTNTWTARNDAERPKRVGLPLMVYDLHKQIPVLFVPVAKESLKAFSYDWDRNAWAELPATGDPPPSHTILVGAYDPIGNHTILGRGLVYGGQVAAGFRRPEGTYVLRHPRPAAAPVVLAAPVDVRVLTATDGATLTWQPVPRAAGYIVYRGSGPTLTKLNESLLTETTYADRVAVPGGGDASMRYVVRAVNRLGVESGPSPWATTIPAEPTRVVARTEKGRAVVTWDPSPQKALRGYAVYRVDSGYGDARTIAKRIAGPVNGTRFEDASRSGATSCKYYVVAVDALGQEGYASHGAWLDDPNRS